MKTALIVIDVQHFFASMATKAIPNVEKLCKQFKASSQPIIFTQHGHTEDELKPPFKNQLVRKWGPAGSIKRGSSDWRIVPELEGLAEGCTVVQKNTYDAFINTGLADVLKKENVERVVVTGCMTDCCVDTTGRSAFNRGFETWMVADACGSANKVQHEAGLRGFGFAFGEVMDTADAIQALKRDWQK